jgi:glycosyltransferase involved in cell wall biosynthesis
VGPNPPPGLGRHAGVEITGEVPDVRPYLDRASVVVAPLRQGGGMRVKVAEALAAEGVGARHGEQLLLADDSEAIAEAAATLLLDPAQRAALGSRARAWAMEHLAWDAPAAAFERLYDSLLAPVP